MTGASDKSDRAAAAAQSSPHAVLSKADIPSAGQSFAHAWWDWLRLQSLWEDDFCDLLGEGEDYDRLGTDDYDGSLEIYGATNDWRLSEAQQRHLLDADFSRVFVNHKDGWQTHYTFGGAFPQKGWRRRYVSDPTVDTTRVLSGPEDNGYWEISHRPHGWNSPMIDGQFAAGYYRIVPDPLDAQGASGSAQDAQEKRND